MSAIIYFERESEDGSRRYDLPLKDRIMIESLFREERVILGQQYGQFYVVATNDPGMTRQPSKYNIKLLEEGIQRTQERLDDYGLKVQVVNTFYSEDAALRELPKTRIE